MLQGVSFDNVWPESYWTWATVEGQTSTSNAG